MGQYWQVVSLDQEEQLSTLVLGKLGEILPGGYAGRHLQQRLMVPLYKQLGEQITKDVNTEQKLKAYLSELRAETPTGRDEAITAIEEGLATMLEEIYSLTWLDHTDICLGDYFNKEDIPSLTRVLFDQFLGTWANTRIICVGDYSDKPPPGCQYPSNYLYNRKYRETTSLTELAQTLLRRFEPHCPSKAQFFQEEYSRLFEEFFPSDQQQVLLNLTSREYVVSRTFWGKELKEGYPRELPGLGDAAMTGICWSQDSSTSMDSNSIDTQGKWAGHRFIIISKLAFDRIAGGQGWKDVSKNVFEVLDDIWESEGY